MVAKIQGQLSIHKLNLDKSFLPDSLTSSLLLIPAFAGKTRKVGKTGRDGKIAETEGINIFHTGGDDDKTDRPDKAGQRN